MRIIINKLLAVLIITTGFASCKKYLDVKPEGKVLLTTYDDYNKVLNYNGLHIYHDAEVKYLSDCAWINELAIVGRDPSLASISFLFDEGKSRFPFLNASSVYERQYNFIARHCLIIENIDKATGGTPAQKKQLKAEARTLRAYSHFVLLNLFAKPYDAATAATDNGIVIKRSFDLEELQSQSTVAEVYNFIENELRESVNDLSAFPENAWHPSKAFGYGLLAKLHLFKREIGKAKEAAQQSLAVNHFIFDMVKYWQDGMVEPVDISNPENTYFGIAGASFTDPLNFIISKEFYESFNSQDARRLALFSTTAPVNQAGSGTAAYIKNITGNARFTYNGAGIKTTDVFLILAECNAREGNIDEAMKLVDSVRRKRILPAGFTPSVAADKVSAIKTVIEERRKEVLFGYNRFWDQRRLAIEPDLAITVVRKFPVVNTAVPQLTYTLQPNSHLYIIPFERSVILNNPNIKQNTKDAMTF